MNPEKLLRAMFDAAVAAAQPAVRVPLFLPAPPKAGGRTIVVGAGKASAAMAKAFDEAWAGDLEGLVVTRYGYNVTCPRLETVEAGHPMPDAAGEKAARRLLDLVTGLTPDDLVVGLFSGGGSALLAAPAPGLTLADEQAVNHALLRSGANIVDMNCLRKHISAIKGGRLAAAAQPARVANLLISDVPGDDPAVIASGPTVPDPTTFADARRVVERFNLDLPASVHRVLEEARSETPKPGDPLFARVKTHLIARPQASLEAAAEVARVAGVTPILMGDALEGEARDLGAEHARLALAGDGAKAPCVWLSGGETTVTIKGKGGRGGRNTEYLLAMALALGGAASIHAIACDTDGTDGSEDNAGALIGPETLSRARAKGLDAAALLDANDAYTFFDGAGGLVVSGPTLTNVNDFRAVLRLP